MKLHTNVHTMFFTSGQLRGENIPSHFQAKEIAVYFLWPNYTIKSFQGMKYPHQEETETCSLILAF